MESIKTSLPKLQLAALPPAARNILLKLEQAGLFRALVIESKGTQVLLDTAFGKLNGQTAQSLTVGDNIMARIVAGESHPTIKIEQLINSSPLLPDRIVQQLLKLTSQMPQATLIEPQNSAKESAPSTPPQLIKVLDHQKNSTQLQIGQKTLTIPLQRQLTAGEFLMLRINQNRQPELVRIAPQQMLKQAISELLPRLNAAADKTPALAALQKLVSTILQLEPEHLSRPETLLQTLKPAVKPDSPIKSAASARLQSRLPDNMVHKQTRPGLAVKSTSDQGVSVHSTSKHSAPAATTQSANRPAATVNPGLARQVEQILQQIARPLADAGRIDAVAIKQILSQLGLLTISKPVPVAQNLSQQIQLLHQIIQQSPQTLQQLITQVIHNQAGHTAAETGDEAQIQHLSNLLRNELLQQLEQTSSQLLVQKSSLKLNQDLQQPLQLNLNIPLQFGQDTIPLKLKLKQREKNHQSSPSPWEINLNFDLPLLGLINTHLLLQGSTLSASFWAVRENTKALIDSHLHEFKKQIQTSGFEPGQFHSYLGEPANNDEQATATSDINLLDVKA